MSGKKNIEKKLGMWGFDKIVGEDGKIHASDYYCVGCYQNKKKTPAEVFWPNIDPDIPSAPYCRPCKEKNVMKILLG
jgi:hypothetical protein